MKSVWLIIITIFFILNESASQDIPFSIFPDWESSANGQIATGLGLADINGDGWKDMVVANGNDISIQHLTVYYNQGDGTFPGYPDWQSADIDYHGHLAIGDIDKDGWPDVAVSVYIGHAGFSEPGMVKVYYNQGGQLESNPSFQSYSYYTFSCALGDADGDGDLDLATTGGEPYSSLYDEGKIYYNRNGMFSEQPEWTSSLAFGSLDVDFADVDLNGYLDLVFASEQTPNYIFLADEKGNISTDPSWESDETSNYINSLDFGLLGTSKYPGIVMTGNNQLGGDGKVRMYNFASGVPAGSAASWTSNPFGYGSGILLADINLDGINDLVYGGWWLPIKIAIGSENGFELSTSYTSSTSSVVEAIQMADLDRDGIQVYQFNKTMGTDSTSVVYLDHQLIENILSVQINGRTIQPAFYSCLPNKNWISFKDPLMMGDALQIQYEHSEKADIVVTNWDSSVGNYIFYNQEISDDGGENLIPKQQFLSVSPNPVAEKCDLQIYSKGNEVISIWFYDLTGKEFYYHQELSLNPGENSISIPVGELAPGTYILKVSSSGGLDVRKVVKK